MQMPWQHFLHLFSFRSKHILKLFGSLPASLLNLRIYAGDRLGLVPENRTKAPVFKPAMRGQRIAAGAKYI